MILTFRKSQLETDKYNLFYFEHSNYFKRQINTG